MSSADWFSAYHTYDEIAAWSRDLAAANPNRVTFVPSIGQTVNGRAIFQLIITGARGQKSEMYIQGLIHAREWIAGGVTQWIAHQLATSQSAEIVAILNQMEFHITPVANPDGYSWSWTNARLWRKNRRQNSPTVFGVDLNRNYDDRWCTVGASRDPASDTYCGPSAASEPETQAVVRHICQQMQRPLAGVDIHAYGQYVLRPYGWGNTLPPDNALLVRAGDGMRDAIRAVHGRSYTSQRAAQLYPAAGGADDWFYGDRARECIGRRLYGHCLELRPVGANPGFQLPPDQIIPNGQEIMPAILFLADHALANPLP